MADQHQSHQPNSASAAPAGGGLGGLAAGWSPLMQGFWPSSAGVPKLNLSTRETVQAFGSSRTFQRLRFHKWIEPLTPSRDALYPWTRIMAAQKRMEDGEQPPELPSEIKEHAKRHAEREPAA